MGPRRHRGRCLLGAAGSWISAHLLAQLPGLSRLPGITEKALPFLWAFGVLLYLAYAAFYYLILAQDQAEEAEQARVRLQMLAQEAELKALRAQLNPHFLFNALNSISALTSVDAGRARDMCVKLSDFLRRSLGLGERASVTLAEELELSKGYLAIEQVRFGARLALDWQVEPGSRKPSFRRSCSAPRGERHQARHLAPARRRNGAGGCAVGRWLREHPRGKSGGPRRAPTPGPRTWASASATTPPGALP